MVSATITTTRFRTEPEVLLLPSAIAWGAMSLSQSPAVRSAENCNIIEAETAARIALAGKCHRGSKKKKKNRGLCTIFVIQEHTRLCIMLISRLAGVPDLRQELSCSRGRKSLGDHD